MSGGESANDTGGVKEMEATHDTRTTEKGHDLDVAPGRSAWMLAGISLGCTAAAAVVTVLVMRLGNRIRRKKRRRSRPGPRHGN